MRDGLDVIHPSLTSVRASVSIMHGLAILTTTFRLWYRVRKRRFWWEDAWAAASLVGAIASLFAVMGITGSENYWIYASLDDPPFPGESPTGHVVADWVMIFGFTTCLWSARLSLIFSLVRLSSGATKLRQVSLYAAAVFGAIFVGLLCQKVYVCGHDLSWEEDPVMAFQCRLGDSIAIAQVVTDFSSDVALVAIPVFLLREVNSPKDQRILILSAFSTSILTSLLSVVHVIFILTPDPGLQTITAQAEIALSLVICNLLVIVTYIYRVLKRKDLELDRRPSAEAGTRTIIFTTVDLNQLTSHPSAEFNLGIFGRPGPRQPSDWPIVGGRYGRLARYTLTEPTRFRGLAGPSQEFHVRQFSACLIPESRRHQYLQNGINDLM
ncbi:hypothetical protein CONPUDRAFT_141691 [Coniophora puteana RWD-64-598 SS2]|uniref:Rhodopsin domain-containing protein n=1 Tax=Coniophora puteana (strain RWD-64-598) TaxID=741705 RepID=A0A5M3N1F5_CONPW|nr:uncharacterized protein CONPUDRAFT_141691 [Coniophora puteana RWD-64-598 SS2]EIW84854.1 hypothetical protein CONPUDRAFT_141691 [Coniophora puteana RWD-64-598 SS2]